MACVTFSIHACAAGNRTGKRKEPRHIPLHQGPSHTSSFIICKGDQIMTQHPRSFRTSRRTLIGAASALAAAGSIGRLHAGLAAQDAAPVRGGSITIAVVGPITSLDPFTSKLGSGDGISYLAIYNTLVGMTPTGEIVPELASEWTISEDGLTYTFTLNSGIAFHDGTSLDAAAVVANFDRYRAEGSTFPGTNKLAPIASVEATDATTVTITLTNPNAPFLAAMTNVQIASPTAVEQLGEDFALKGVGSGPFKIDSWEPGSTATFVRNDAYWQQADDGQPLPYLDQLVIEGVPDDSVRLLNLRSGTFVIIERVEQRFRGKL
jgi:ABC-type transport system substrate-binding protein